MKISPPRAGVSCQVEASELAEDLAAFLFPPPTPPPPHPPPPPPPPPPPRADLARSDSTRPEACRRGLTASASAIVLPSSDRPIVSSSLASTRRRWRSPAVPVEREHLARRRWQVPPLVQDPAGQVGRANLADRAGRVRTGPVGCRAPSQAGDDSARAAVGRVSGRARSWPGPSGGGPRPYGRRFSLPVDQPPSSSKPADGGVFREEPAQGCRPRVPGLALDWPSGRSGRRRRRGPRPAAIRGQARTPRAGLRPPTRRPPAASSFPGRGPVPQPARPASRGLQERPGDSPTPLRIARRLPRRPIPRGEPGRTFAPRYLAGPPERYRRAEHGPELGVAVQSHQPPVTSRLHPGQPRGASRRRAEGRPIAVDNVASSRAAVRRASRGRASGPWRPAGSRGQLLQGRDADRSCARRSGGWPCRRHAAVLVPGARDELRGRGLAQAGRHGRVSPGAPRAAGVDRQKANPGCLHSAEVRPLAGSSGTNWMLDHCDRSRPRRGGRLRRPVARFMAEPGRARQELAVGARTAGQDGRPARSGTLRWTMLVSGLLADEGPLPRYASRACLHRRSWPQRVSRRSTRG